MKIKNAILKSYLSYALIGTLVGLFEIAFFSLLYDWFHVYYLISNLITFFVTVVMLYFLNGMFVYKTQSFSRKKFFVFFISRVFGFILDSTVLYLCLNVFVLNSLLSKFISSSSTTVINYFVGKKIFNA